MLPLFTFERLARKAGIKRITADAVEELRDAVDEYGMAIAERAVKLSRHANRRTVMGEDVRLAARKA